MTMICLTCGIAVPLTSCPFGIWMKFKTPSGIALCLTCLHDYDLSHLWNRGPSDLLSHLSDLTFWNRGP